MIKARLVTPKAMFAKTTQVEKRTFWVKSYALILGLFFSASCLAVEFYVRPTFTQSTEYDDNIRMLSEQEIRSNLARSVNRQRKLKDPNAKNLKRADISAEDVKNVDTSAYGIISTAETVAGVQSDNYNVFFKGKVDVKKYFSDLDLDTEDFFLNLDARYDLDIRNTFRFSSRFSQESTITSELAVTGETQENVPRITWAIEPEWQHNLSETKHIVLSYSHEETTYEEDDSTTTESLNPTSRYSDYINDSVSLTFQHQWNEKLLNYITARWSRFAVPVRKSETDQYTVSGGLEYEISETWTASLMGGIRYTLTERDPTVFFKQSSIILNDGNGNLFNVPILDGNGDPVIVRDETLPFSDSQVGMVFSFATNKKFEKGHVGASYSRDTSPTGFGRLQTFDRFSVDFLYRITNHLDFILAGGVNVTKATADENEDRDRTYYHVRPQLRWQFNEQLSLSGGYRYRMEETTINDDRDDGNTNNSENRIQKTIPDSTDSHSVFLSLRYEWDKFRTQDFY